MLSNSFVKILLRYNIQPCAKDDSSLFFLKNAHFLNIYDTECWKYHLTFIMPAN